MLTPENIAELAVARRLGTGLRRAATVARVDGWTTGIFGLITLVLSIGSIHAMLLGIGMATLAVLQLRAADRLARLDDHAPAVLARNQAILGLLLVLYAGVSLFAFLQDPAAVVSSLDSSDPEVNELIAPYIDLVRSLLITVYIGVMVVAVLGCGLTALYYLRQRKRILAYRSSTPPWILAMQSAGVTI